MKEKILEIRNLSKSYGKGKKAVDDLSLDVYAGDIYGFINWTKMKKRQESEQNRD